MSLFRVCATSSSVHHFTTISAVRGYSSETPNSGQNQRFLVPCDLEIWWMTLKKQHPILCYFKLCASYHNHRWVKTRVKVRKRPIWVKIGDLWSCVNLKFDGLPWIGHPFYATLSADHCNTLRCQDVFDSWWHHGKCSPHYWYPTLNPPLLSSSTADQANAGTLPWFDYHSFFSWVSEEISSFLIIKGFAMSWRTWLDTQMMVPIKFFF